MVGNYSPCIDCQQRLHLLKSSDTRKKPSTCEDPSFVSKLEICVPFLEREERHKAGFDSLSGIVCRSYGFLDPVLHHIGDTHVAHHLFSYMPHYHAQEATKVSRPYTILHDLDVELF